MKKTNIFNRNTNSPSFRGNAESPRCCRELVCGKTDGIPAFAGMTGKARGVAECKFPSREGWRVAPAGVWFAALVALFVATPSFATPTELDKKTVASKAYVDTKQDIIETGNVMFHDDPEGTEGDVYVPGLVAYDSQTNALSGNKIGILDWQTAKDVEGNLNFFSYEGGGYGSEMDNYVPTVRAVAESLQEIVVNTPYWNALPWSNTQSVAINAYNSTFGNGTNNWAGNSDDLINGQFLANSLALKQNKLPEQNDDLIPGQQFRNDSTGTAASVLAPTTAGNVTQVALWDADGAEPDAWDVGTYFSDATADERNAIKYSIPTVGAVEAGLSQKQNKMVCAGWDSETHTDEHCWLWSIAE